MIVDFCNHAMEEKKSWWNLYSKLNKWNSRAFDLIEPSQSLWKPDGQIWNQNSSYLCLVPKMSRCCLRMPNSNRQLSHLGLFKMSRCWKENGHQQALGWWVDWEVMRHVAVLANDQPSNPFGFAKIKSSNPLQFILELHCLVVYVVQKGHLFIWIASHLSLTPLFLRNICTGSLLFFLCWHWTISPEHNEFKHV